METNRTELGKAIAVTAELCGAELSIDVIRAMVDDLARFPGSWISGALKRCSREITGRFTLAEIIKRLDDGRPLPDAAWAMCPRDEMVTVVWTDEMSAAWAVASRLLDDGDEVAARMAFKDAYQQAVQKARDAALMPTWTVSLGHDPHGRETPVLQAVAAGRLTAEYAQKLLPHRDQPSEQVLQLINSESGAMRLNRLGG